ncbi:MAG: APC family permease [Verrucomicrobium sp.]
MPPARLSLTAATAIVVASMVGTGVFTSVGFQLKDIPAGFPILVLWLIGGVVSLCGAFCYAELGAMMPRSGGEYHLLSRAYHPLIGFLAGWVSLTAGFAAPIAAAAKLFGSYASELVPSIHQTVLAVGLVLAIMTIQLCHLKWIERFQLGFTFLKVALVIAFITGACWIGQGDWSVLQPKSGDGAYFLSKPYAVSLVYVMYAYAGWNAASYIAGEIKNPARNLPLALVLGTSLVTVLYVMLNAVFLVGTPWSEMSGKMQSALVAARSIFGLRGGDAMGGLIAFGLVAHVSAMLFAGTRVLRVMGQDRSFLRPMDKTNRLGAPWLAVLVITAVVLILMITGTFEQLLLYIETLLLACSLLCILAVPWLRWRQPGMERPFKVPLYPLPPILFTVVVGWMLISLLIRQPVETAWGAATLVIGVILYFFDSRRKPVNVTPPEA